MSANMMDHPNEGVKCVVDTCKYHMAGDHCSAEQIVVRAVDASTSNQTDCATFIPQSRKRK
ncbi:DUF1540 domain-containing protein [Ruminiclostridium herbifermentans]|uniref:DUF1540 domain-containing protein n=1 Tax=Ruminiclostridium herbifermentans TaxID=2488810 RepID=A0A4U7JIY5_9FIRM|nr:DUF1540 domain-containing protein [Ruminiclostridium herbifermentans]QNU65994.1 DUF1540 domain-containing protein [Ruminiclostridium herbifermentans]